VKKEEVGEQKQKAFTAIEKRRHAIGLNKLKLLESKERAR
jgi:hypothetical protein